MLHRHHQCRQSVIAVHAVRTATVCPHNAVIARARLDKHSRALFPQQLLDFPLQHAAAHPFLPAGIIGRAFARFRRFGQLRQRFFIVAFGLGLEFQLYVASGAHHHNFALQLALVFLQVFFAFDFQEDGLAGNHAVGAGRPGLGIGNERLVLRLQHFHTELFQRPAAAEGAPRLQMGIFEAPFVELVQRPLRRLHVVGRIGEPRAIHIGEIAQNVHHLRILQAFLADALHRLPVHRLFRRRKTEHHKRKKQQQKRRASHV